jgi:hypothetical protein
VQDSPFGPPSWVAVLYQALTEGLKSAVFSIRKSLAVSAFRHPTGMPPIESGHQQDAEPAEDGKAEGGKLRKFQSVLEEGHAAAGTTLFLAVSCGLLLGFALPTDPNIPGTALCIRLECLRRGDCHDILKHSWKYYVIYVILGILRMPTKPTMVHMIHCVACTQTPTPEPPASSAGCTSAAGG